MCSFFSRKSLLVLSNAQNFLAARATPEARRGPWVWHLKTFTFPDMTCKCYTFSLFESHALPIEHLIVRSRTCALAYPAPPPCALLQSQI